jgi:hypothetical protein
MYGILVIMLKSRGFAGVSLFLRFTLWRIETTIAFRSRDKAATSEKYLKSLPDFRSLHITFIDTRMRFSLYYLLER